MFTYFLQYIFYQFKTVSKITLGIIRKWPLKIETISITLGNTVKHRSKLERKVKTMFTDNMTLVYTGIIFLHQFIVICRYSFFFFFFTNWRFLSPLHWARLSAPFFQEQSLTLCLHVSVSANSHNISNIFIIVRFFIMV